MKNINSKSKLMDNWYWCNDKWKAKYYRARVRKYINDMYKEEIRELEKKVIK